MKKYTKSTGLMEYETIRLSKAEIKTLRQAGELAKAIRNSTRDPNDFIDPITDAASDISLGVYELLSYLRGQEIIIDTEEII